MMVSLNKILGIFRWAFRFNTSTMKVLTLNYHIFILMSIFPTSIDQHFSVKMRNKLFSLTVFLLVFGGLVFSMTFIKRFVVSDLENTLYALFQIAAFGCQVYLFIVGYKIGPKFAELYPKLQQIYDSSKVFYFL